MTYINKYHHVEDDELKELLIKNLPAKIKAGNEKENSNIKEYSSHVALQQCKFINFNSKDRISFMVFDFDEYQGKTALDYFQNFENLLDYQMEHISLEPTYILTTQKGFHFAYHLKNHVFTDQQKAVDYLRNIKQEIGKKMGCDPYASNRLNGVWRNPLLHEHYYSSQINYELNDFNDYLPKKVYEPKSNKHQIIINPDELVEGNRNNALFRYAMRFAAGKKTLIVEQIITYLTGINRSMANSLPSNEILTISRSVFNYWQNSSIDFGSTTNNNSDIDVGAMKFEKMSGLTYSAYLKEKKRRQRLAAIRTNAIRNHAKNTEQLQNARNASIEYKQLRNQSKIANAIRKLENENCKITISAISKISGLNRRTVKKYYGDIL